MVALPSNVVCRWGDKKKEISSYKKPHWGIIKVLFKMLAEGLRVRG